MRRRVPRCGPSTPWRPPPPPPPPRIVLPRVRAPYTSTPTRDWRSLAYHPGSQWKPSTFEKLSLWLWKKRLESGTLELPSPEEEILEGSRRAFYVVSELLAPALKNADVPGENDLKRLFTPRMMFWYERYREYNSRESRQEELEKEQQMREELGEEEDDEAEEDDEDEEPVIFNSKHEVVNQEILRWEEDIGAIKYTTAARYPHPISGRMLFDHLWVFHHTTIDGESSRGKHYLLNSILFPPEVE